MGIAKALVQIKLPNDPGAALEAGTKQYIDSADGTKVPTSRSVAAGTGLIGGGDLSADRSFAVAYGTSSTTACAGNDTRLSDSRVPTAHNHAADDVNSGTLDVARVPTGTSGSTVALGNHAHGYVAPAIVTATLTNGQTYTPDANNGTNGVWKLTANAGNFTLAAPSNPADMQIVRVAVLASGAIRTVTFSGFIASTTYPTTAYAIPSGKWWTGTFQYISAIGWQYVGNVTQA